ncbi:MAG: pilus assembly protein [Lachnospiraceae bacterium]|nr:pilus assembly protein [Lachnospiraceae bacterium]
MKKLKETAGSYTVEAALVIPLFIFLLAGGVSKGIDLFSETKDKVAVKEWQQETVASEVAVIRRLEALKRGVEILED